jgi:hypothetical protein
MEVPDVAATAVHLDEDARWRLKTLGLTVDDVHTVVLQAHADVMGCTGLDAVSAPGFIRWSRTNRYLGERLLPAGWTRRDPYGLPQTVNPSGETAITATTGDVGTGVPAGRPSTKYAKGIAIEEAVEATARQLNLFEEDMPSSERDDALVMLWILLYHLAAGEIRLELSLPVTIVNGMIDSWSERIIIPAVPLDDDDLFFKQPPDDGEGDLDIAVVRR